MKEDKYRYTKFGLINALLSLIPIFPVWTLIPGVLFGMAFGNLFDNCELGFFVTLITCIISIIFILFRYFKRFEVSNTITTERQLKWDFRLFSLGIYTLLNTIILMIILGTHSACYGDGQTILACIFSGPLTSIGLILLGVAVDIKTRN